SDIVSGDFGPYGVGAIFDVTRIEREIGYG
ncbi:MAG: hypothetical protein JWP34_4850, partial [Massilia sp.]|nr:hypothetical protein [Massilia sp.]